MGDCGLNLGSRRRARGARSLTVPLALAVLAGTATARASPPTRPALGVRVSNLTTLTRWAFPQQEAAVVLRPSVGSTAIGHLSFLTREGQAAVYLELRTVRLGGRSWILVPLPGRPNGARGWVPAAALGEPHVTHEHLRVSRKLLRATLYRGHAAIWSAPVGIGRPSLPTPTGHYYVTEKLISAELGRYGPYALGTSAYAPTLTEWPGGGVVGIHGTDQPWLIPGHPSHGCIRLRDADVSRLWQLVEVGTPVEIV
jgi:hypothetical protein